MRDRPILFKDQMVRAILNGNKFQTRRTSGKYLHGINRYPDEWAHATLHKDGSFIFHGPRKVSNEFAQKAYPEGGGGFCPYGITGDRLWVRETWADNIPGCPNGITYRADHADPKGDGPAHPIKWKPSIFMPRSCSRILLTITDVKVERVQDISENGAMAEGVQIAVGKITSKERFRLLWISINGA
jgi:hypothetical protein